MSKLACNTKKFQKADVRGMQIHNQRESENSKNKDIDHEKTHLNFDLQNDQPINYTERVKEIMADGYKNNKPPRKDAVLLCSTLVTAENEFFKNMPIEKQREFFEVANNFLSEKYGKQNVVASMVHLDEKTPHLHFQFVPLTMDDGRLCAKELTNRKNLLDIQDSLPQVLQNAGFKIERGKKQSKAKHRETEDWKREQEEMVAQLEVKEKELETKNQALTEKEKELEMKTQAVERELTACNQRLEVARQSRVTEKEIQEIHARTEVKSGYFGGKSYVEIAVPDYNKLTKTATAGTIAIAENKPLKEQAVQAQQIPKLKQHIGKLTDDNKNLSKQVDSMQTSLKHFQTKTYKQYHFRGLNDTKAAAVMMRHDGISKTNTRDVIANNSPAAPPRSNDARNFADGIIDAALKMDSEAIALAVQIGNEDENIDWGMLTKEQAQEKSTKINQEQSL